MVGERRFHVQMTAMLAAIALLTAGTLLTTPADSASGVTTAPTLTVQGNHLADSRTNTTFVPHGVNWPSFEYACQQGWGYSGGYSAAEAQAIASWGVNIVRLPLNEDCWLGTAGSPAYGTAAGYRAAVQSWVSMLHAAGLAVILDLHWTAPPGYPADGQRAMPDSQSVTFWNSVASSYAGDHSVMFDLFNEPYSRWSDATNSWAFQLTWSCWKNGGCQAPVENDTTTSLSGTTYTTVGMSQLVSTVRSAGAAQPIMLGGIDYSNDLTGWLANRPSDTQLVASWHNYQGQDCDTVTCWNSEIEPVAAAVPVIAGEFGEDDGGSSFLSTFMTWADGHGIGYAPWAWWDVSPSESISSSYYALYSGASFTPKAPSGTTYHDHLAALDRSGLTATQCYVKALYTDVLGRAPSVDEITGWAAVFDSGSATGVQLSANFVNSDEYGLDRIAAAYQGVLERGASPSELQGWLGQIHIGRVGPDDIDKLFMSSDEYFNRSGGSNESLVGALYLRLIGRAASASEEAGWGAIIASRGRMFVIDTIWHSLETARSRVTAMYQDYLGRTPDLPETDGWVSLAISQGDGAVRTALTSSQEYRTRAVSRFG